MKGADRMMSKGASLSDFFQLVMVLCFSIITITTFA